MELYHQAPAQDRIGISSACFYPMDTFLSLKKCVELNFRCAELFINAPSELYDDFINTVADFCRKNDFHITSIHPYTSGYEYLMFFSEYRKRARDAEIYYENYFRAAQKLGAEYVIFHGDSSKSPFCGFETYCEVYASLHRKARAYGITLLHENVSRARAGSCAFLSRFSDLMQDEVYFVFDLKQALRADENPIQMLDIMGKKLRHVHINDWQDGKCRLPCMGTQNLPEIIKKLNQIGFTGKYIFEVYSDNYQSEAEILRSKQAFQALLEG